MKRVLLAGEGRNELGGRAGEAQYVAQQPDPGVLEVLLEALELGKYRIQRAVRWKDIHKYRAPGRFAPLRGTKAEERAIRVLALMASEGALDVVVFSRDADNDPTRHEVVERTLSELAQAMPARAPMAGAVATPCLEAWLLALGGVTKTEAMTPAKSERMLGERGLAPKDTAAMVEFVRRHGFGGMASDATSLRLWRDRVTAALRD